MVTPLAGVSQEDDSSVARAVRADRTFDVSICQRDRVPGSRGDGSGRSFNPDPWMEPKEQRRRTISSSSPCAPREALDDAG
jgi:hypothetical protein